MFIIIIIILILVALGAIAFVVFPKLSLLSSLRTDPSPEEKLQQLKKNIIIERILRKVKLAEKKLLSPDISKKVGDKIKELYTRLRVAEEKYRIGTREAKIDMLLKRGQENIRDDSELAEQCFIEVINFDKRNADAYLGLAQVYLAKKKFNEAREVIEFLAKLDSTVSNNYIFALAEAYFQSGDLEQARKYGERVLKSETENPRYLDFLTELAIMGGNQKQAQQYLIRLEKVNPENAKIAEFGERIEKM